MKKILALATVVLALGATTMALDAEAKRLGGAKSSGMQRQQTTQPAGPNTPGSPAQAAPAAAGAAAAAPAAAAAKRSWMGPIAGLAAGLGLAALASHLGFGPALANIMMMVLLGVAVLAVIGFIMRKRAAANGTPSMAGAGAGSGGAFGGGMGRANSNGGGLLGGSRIGSALGGVTAAAAQPSAIPADFDTAGFARNAKDQFLALQSANDARDLQRLRDVLTPEMFEEVRGEVEARGDVPQKTEVFGLNAQVLEVVEEAERYIVSVRFTGSVREQDRADTEDLDEVWHLTKPRAGFGG
ncbi:MAG: Tim44 domain-containing protein, partial [Comamonadaceae bacterium]